MICVNLGGRLHNERHRLAPFLASFITESDSSVAIGYNTLLEEFKEAHTDWLPR